MVGYARRNFMTPLPRFANWEAFNTYLEAQCRNRQGDIPRGHRESIGERFERDRAALMALPPSPFDACDKRSMRVSSLSLVRYRTNDYSVRRGPGKGLDPSAGFCGGPGAAGPRCAPSA